MKIMDIDRGWELTFFEWCKPVMGADGYPLEVPAYATDKGVVVLRRRHTEAQEADGQKLARTVRKDYLAEQSSKKRNERRKPLAKKS